MSEYVRIVEEVETEERPHLIGRRIFIRDRWEMAQVSLKPGAKMPVHKHEDGEQCYYILSGQGLLEMGGKAYVLRPGMAAFVPMGLDHHTENTGNEPFTYVEVRTTHQA